MLVALAVPLDDRVAAVRDEGVIVGSGGGAIDADACERGEDADPALLAALLGRPALVKDGVRSRRRAAAGSLLPGLRRSLAPGTGGGIPVDAPDTLRENEPGVARPLGLEPGVGRPDTRGTPVEIAEGRAGD